MIVPVLTLLVGAVAAKHCRNATVHVDISARNGVFGNVMVPQTNLDATTFVQNVTQQGRNFTDVALTGYATVSGKYKISTQYCEPDAGLKASTAVQVLTHGIGFDKTYWDLSFNNFNYSYVEAATKAGYATLSFDRLGVGKSSHGEPRDEIQSFLEVAATVALTKMLRAGTFPSTNHTFTKVVHVGHSFGSGQTFALANMYPELTDGIVLTGFSLNSTFVGLFFAGANFQQASQNQPLRFGNITKTDFDLLTNYLAGSPLLDFIAGIDSSKDIPKGQNLPNGYLISSNTEANQLLFALPKFFDPKILTVGELSKQPVTIGELLTLGSVPAMNKYTGPVLVLTGQEDVPYCGGNCLATGNPALASIPAAVKKAFPGVSDANFLAYVQPNTAHGINIHYNATGAYSVINKFLASKGL